ncbi:MAG TPA: VCBS repeat-containing protein [Bacteroidales bacterium]|nr:VCBS repeat-containing protein [Bacteroidales bacterium]
MKSILKFSLTAFCFILVIVSCKEKPTLPTLSTSNISLVSYNSVVSGGEVKDDGGSLIIARGICWSTTQNPTISDSKTSDGSGIGVFTSSITGLSPGTTYYFRAYATNSVGTTYGNQMTTFISAIMPLISTSPISYTTENSATGGGNITEAGGSPVTSRGLCWSTSMDPTINDSKTSDGSGIGTFNSSITGLTAGRLYYVRAYASNSVGTSYGATMTLTNYLKISKISITIPGISADNINIGINGSISGTVAYTKDGIEHLIVTPTLFTTEPLIPAIHLIKKNGAWIYEESYPDGSMGCARSSASLNNEGAIAFADHGLELSSGTWPFGNILVARTIGDKLSWSTVSNARSFYHSISSEDINNDGLKDIVGLHMGTRGDWTNDNLHTYVQNTGETFSENRNIISLSEWPGNHGAGAVLVQNVMGDSRPEVIRADYGQNPTYPSDRYSIAIFSYNSNTQKYEMTKSPGAIGVFANPDRGATSIKAVDVDKDGDSDLAIATEGTNFNGIEIWLNDGQGNFSPSNQKLGFDPTQMSFREFEVLDIDNDGWEDIILNPYHYGKLFRIGSNGYSNGSGIILNNLIWKNNSGTFAMLSKDIRLPDLVPTYLKAFKINDKFYFIGIEGKPDGSLIITEIIPCLQL